MKIVIQFSIIVLSVLLSACNSTPKATIDTSILNSKHQFNIQPVESYSEVFQLNNQIKAKLAQYFHNDEIGVKRAKMLMAFLVNSGDDSMSYLSGANLTANQAFSNMNANCLSLSILTHAIARQVGLRTQFQRVHIPEYWDESQGYSLLTGHVNIKIFEVDNTQDSVKTLYVKPASVTVDFDPNSRAQHFSTSAIDTNTILSMFYNNKGAMEMINGDLDMAYSYYKAAVESDPYHDGAWGNLGILYRLTQQYDLAERAYNQALAINHDNRNALGNLAKLYHLTERDHEAKVIEANIHNLRKSNPYYMLVLGNEAFKHGNLSRAKHFYQKAYQLDHSIHGSFFGLAKVAFEEGNREKAEYYLNKAYKASVFEHDKARYEGKLALLRGVASNQLNSTDNDER
ncbi:MULTISPECIES: tetratricopeptide repeat protein [Pseudoalteromonas]|uniref:Tetratricopeptide repeat protein n=1 Tax=Pseudoalteromonas maricaloris TaxID=184924 RepID=A0A8I2KNV3_9GAMM|nr:MULTISPECIES: tetratricopeptide repeat protein [Pseudoalteromonas]NLR20137.1 tetratricopeptide repeat protein [Pseudoalteromonas maricaloris]RZG16356.1 tetratricopeptide repeat protein [Pseudoalteromonas sp. CO342X]WOX27278.1 tetratricopeptide repeat protein [Pseudoalteromonas maricaloris]